MMEQMHIWLCTVLKCVVKKLLPVNDIYVSLILYTYIIWVGKTGVEKCWLVGRGGHVTIYVFYFKPTNQIAQFHPGGTLPSITGLLRSRRDAIFFGIHNQILHNYAQSNLHYET